MTFGHRKTKVDHGLHIVRNRRADPVCRWYVYAWRGGPQIYVSEGERPKITKEILDLATTARKEMRRTPANNIDGLITAYRNSPEWVKLGDRTKRDYDKDLGKVRARYGSAPLGAFDDRRMRTDVMAWRASMADHPRTADRAVVMLSTLLGWGVTQGRLALNVASGIPALYTSNRAAVIWTDADWLALLQHCSKDLVHALRLASMTGLRLGDLIRLETSHVGPLAIAYQTRKKNRRVVIPILPELRKLLNEIAGDGIILRNSRGQPWTESGLGGVFQKAKTKAKANGFNMELRIHDLRGTYATWLANRGLTDQEIGRIIAWSEKQVAEVRRRYVDERHVVASIVERLQAKNS